MQFRLRSIAILSLLAASFLLVGCRSSKPHPGRSLRPDVTVA